MHSLSVFVLFVPMLFVPTGRSYPELAKAQRYNARTQSL